MHQSVIDGNLIQRSLGQGYGVSLELQEHARLQLAVIDYGICPQAVCRIARDGFQRLLYGYQGGRIMEFLHQAVKEILSYILFRRQTHILASPIAEDVV